MRVIKISNDITIKTPTVKDAKESFELLHNDRAELMDVFNFVTKDSTIEDEQDFIRSLDSDKYLFNIHYKDEVCGKIGVFSHDEIESSYEIYYYIGSKFRGRGIATVTIANFVEYVLCELGASKVKFYINTDNDASIKMAKRLNLKFIETVKERDFCNGVHHDQHLYEIWNK